MATSGSLLVFCRTRERIARERVCDVVLLQSDEDYGATIFRAARTARSFV
jgi:hypothetical protein